MKKGTWLVALLSQCMTAPFIIEPSLAMEVDSRIGPQICDLKKSEYSRLYWYEYTSERNGFMVSIWKVRFAVIDNGKSEVRHVASLPLEYEDSNDLVALGLYDLVDESVASVRCFR